MVAGILVVLIAGGVIAAMLYLDPARLPGRGVAAPTPAARPEGPVAVLALTSNMYARPARTSDLVAIIPEGRSARITGRTDDSEWLRVIYPPASTLEGWVPRANAVAASLPDVTGVPAVAGGADDTGGGGDGGGEALPDLTISSVEVQPNGVLLVRITNAGRAVFNGEVAVQVTNADGNLVGLLDVDLTQSPLGAGRSASVNTGVVIRTTGLFTIEVDRQGVVPEANEGNNTRRVLLVGVGG